MVTVIMNCGKGLLSHTVLQRIEMDCTDWHFFLSFKVEFTRDSGDPNTGLISPVLKWPNCAQSVNGSDFR